MPGVARWLAGAAAAWTLAATDPAAAASWDKFETILWHNHGPAALTAAHDLGVDAGLMFGVRQDPAPAALAADFARRAAPLRAAGLGFYVENIATDFYAAYHRWTPDHPVTWLFDQAQARHRADPADPSVFERTPSLSDPAALARIAARLAAHVAVLGAEPLFYDLGDETGIADLTAAWDFDLSPASLAGLRDWLRGEYGTLAALNAEWGSGFADWDAVRPLTTTAALGVRDGNFAAWSDFKAWMDVAYARALRAGTDAVHAANPAARAGIEGAQTPGWGGYDYTRLAGAVDVMEVTGDGSAQAIAQALNPALITLTTLGDAPGGAAALWRAVLDGYRGAVLWDPGARVATADGTPGPRGTALRPVLDALAGPIGAALRDAVPAVDSVAILYSPASFRIRWILDRQRDAAAGADWSRRRSETELEDNALRVATRQAVEGLAHLGLHPHWLPPAGLHDGSLTRDGIKLLILPHALALSDAEVAGVRSFVAAGGQVLADIPPGAFDAHGRQRASLPLQDAVAPSPGLTSDPNGLAAAVRAAGLVPLARLARPDGQPATGATVRVLHRRGGGSILAIQRDDDVPPPGADATLVLTLARPLRLSDLFHPAVQPATDRRVVALAGSEPVLLDADP